MSTTVKEISEGGVSLIHRGNQLLLQINCHYIESEPYSCYNIDLWDGKEHRFFVRYFEVGFPLYAAYIPEDVRSSPLHIELPTSIIDYLENSGFISDIELYDQELEQITNRPQDCLVTVCRLKHSSTSTIH